jgi:glycerol kinase
MSRAQYVLSLDQGTTSTRCIVFDQQARPVGAARREVAQHYPASGWVEHNAEDIWRDSLATARAAIEQSAVGIDGIAALGIANQRETAVVWERDGGRPIHNAIVWQDRRTAQECGRLQRDGAETLVRARTGLLLDPYFSATKVAWILDNVPGARARADRGELAFGTIDSFLLWRFTGGKLHATDVTNASRTLLFDIHRQQWDQELLRLFRIPRSLLPQVRDSSGIYAMTAADIFDKPVPIAGVAGDQQAALFGQACFEPGTAKSTYGSGCFLLLNTGERAPPSSNRLLTTLACRLNGRTSYALEGSIFVAGAAIKWLRDGLKHISDAAQSEAVAESLDGNQGVYMVPAFVGLGAPHWRPDVRGLISGLTLDVTGAHLVRAALEAVAYQTLDLCDAMTRDGASPVRAIRVDGGMAANNWLCQFLADMLGARVERPRVLETTSLGAAFLAGLATGVWSDLAAVAATWESSAQFEPRMSERERAALIDGWRMAVARTLLQ